MMCHLCWSQTVNQSWFKEICFAGRPTRTRWVDLQSCFSGCPVRTSSFIISVSHPENPETVTWEDPTDQQLSCQSSKSPSAEQNWIKLWPKTAFHRFCCPTLPVSHPENPLVTSFSLQPSAPLVSDVWNISSSFALSARSPSLPTLW